jgi:hypothetical protein
LVFAIALQRFAEPPGIAFACRRWFRLFARLPDRRGALDSRDIGHFEFCQLVAEVGISSVAGIGRYHALRDTPLTRTLDLVQGDFRFGLKLNPFWHPGLLPSRAVFDPRLWQVQTVRYRHTCLLRGHRKADRYPAVILFANLTAILSGHSDRLTTFFRKSSVVYHPCHYRIAPQHRRDYKIQTAIQDSFVTPRGVGDHMMQRLVHASDIVACKPRGHGLDTLPFPGQQQAGAIVLQRSMTIGMPCGFGQALNIRRKA